jgi:hypothetical protein
MRGMQRRVPRRQWRCYCTKNSASSHSNTCHCSRDQRSVIQKGGTSATKDSDVCSCCCYSNYL